MIAVLYSGLLCSSTKQNNPFSQETLLCYVVGTNNPHAARNALGQTTCFSYPLLSAWFKQTQQATQGTTLCYPYQAIGVVLGSNILHKTQQNRTYTFMPIVGSVLPHLTSVSDDHLIYNFYSSK
jgi:hypothetical protein